MRSLEEIRRDDIQRQQGLGQHPGFTGVTLSDIDIPFGTIFRLVFLVTLSQVILAVVGWLLDLLVTEVVFL